MVKTMRSGISMCRLTRKYKVQIGAKICHVLDPRFRASERARRNHPWRSNSYLWASEGLTT